MKNLDLLKIISFGSGNDSPATEVDYVKHIVSLLKNPTEYQGLRKGAFPEWYSPNQYHEVHKSIHEVSDLELCELEMIGIAKMLFKRFGSLGYIFHSTFNERVPALIADDDTVTLNPFIKEVGRVMSHLHHTSRFAHEPYYPVRKGALLEKLNDLLEDDDLMSLTGAHFMPITIANLSELDIKIEVGTTIGIWGWTLLTDCEVVKIPTLRYHLKVLE